MNDRRINHVCNTLLIEPQLWERCILWWIKLEKAESDTHIIYYKVFWDRLYIIGTVCKLPKVSATPQQLQASKGLMDGFNTPWLN
jgi:hypothetical protein